MTTDIPVGSFVKFRYRNEWEYAVINEGGTYTIIGLSAIPHGTEVIRCVWKGDALLARSTSRRIATWSPNRKWRN